MGRVTATADAREVTVRGRVIRADGTVEELGVLAYYHRNPLRRLWWRLTHWRP